MIKLLIMVSPLLLPTLAFMIAWRVWPGRRVRQLVTGGLGGALPGAFLGSAASAMATGSDPTVAAARGAGIGFALGVGLGLLFLLLARFVVRIRS